MYPQNGNTVQTKFICKSPTEASNVHAAAQKGFILVVKNSPAFESNYLTGCS